jgi:hypothetical protein
MRILIAVLWSLALSAAAHAGETWDLVKPDGLGFQVEFPGKPEFTEQSGDDGGKITTYALRSTTAVYDVTIWDLEAGAVGAEDVSRVLDNMRDRSVAGVRGTLRTETKIDISGRPARDVVADTMGMVWRGRTVIANDRIYQIVAIVKKDTETSDPTEKYMTSFKLLERAVGETKK